MLHIEVIQMLKDRKAKLALAESCTGGSLAALLTSVPGVSQVFWGGVVAYANEVKERILKVNPLEIQKFGAVSAPVAQAMAKGALTVMNSDWAIAITGVAGPSGGSVEKPVGTVFISIAGLKIANDGQAMTQQFLFSGNREEIQKASRQKALELLQEQIFKWDSINK